MISKKLYQGHNFGKETIRNEFKQICLTFEEEESKQLLLNKKTLSYSKFNSMIYDTLNNAIYKYIPRYFSIFSKACLSGNLYLGINDDGIIEGIPWYGKLTKKIIKRMIRNVLESDRSRGIKINEFTGEYEIDDRVLDWYYTNLEITITKLNTDPELIKQSHVNKLKKLHDLIERNKKLEKEQEEFKIIYDKWHKIIFRYSGKLNNFIIDDTLYDEVITFIKESIKNKKYLKYVLDFYKDKTNFDEFISNNDKKIRTIYDNPSNPIIWIIRFKDMKTAHYKYLKPKKPYIKPINNLYSTFSSHVQNITPFLLESDKEVNLYVISISFPFRMNTLLQFRDTIASEWKERKRCLLSTGEPTCT